MMRKSRLSAYKQDRLTELFVAGATARVAGRLVGVNRKTAVTFFDRLRRIIALELAEEHAAEFGGEIEVDESYFGGHRKGKRGRGAAGKVPVFGLLKRGDKVYAEVIPNAASATLVPLVTGKVVPDSVVFSDSWVGYDKLDTSGLRHERINHDTDFAVGSAHINGIENFWSQAKRHLRRFNGVPKAQLGLYLMECEWRFNHRDPAEQFQSLKQWVRKHLR